MQSKNEGIVLSILVLGTLMGALDTTIVLLALPSITDGLNSNLGETIWVILIYLLVISITTMQFGRLGDLFGRSRMFNLGFAIFTLGSALCGFASTNGFLVGFRAIQAIGGALMQSTSGAIIADTFGVGRRGRAYGYIAMGWNIGGMLGIVLGGMLTTFIGWRFIFFINVPIGIVAFLLGMKYLNDNPKVIAKLDLAGMLLLGSALTLLCYGAVDFASAGLSHFNILLMIAGIIAIVVFLYWESIIASPALDLHAFNNKVLSASIFAAFFQSLGFLSVTFLIIMYLQGIRGLDPFTAALLLTPGYIISSFLSPYMGRLSDRFGARGIATIGIVLMCFSIMMYMTLTISSSYYIIILASIISGIGGAMFWPANSSAVMSNAQHQQYGGISGLLRLMTNIGTLGSFIIAITAATLATSRSTAFSVFIGTSKLIGGVSIEFLSGIHAALLMCLVILIIAGILSLARGKEERQSKRNY